MPLAELDRTAERPAPGSIRVAVPLPRVLRIFWLASLAAFGLMFLIAWVHARPGVARDTWDPLGDSLYYDLFDNMPTFTLVHTPAFWSNADPLTPTVAYPPFGAVLMGILYASGYPAVVYTSVAVCALLFAGWQVRGALLRLGINRWTAILFPATVGVCSFPIVGLLQKGNIELFLWIFAVAGIWAFLHGHQNVAAILWALAASEKLYPVIFFVLFVPRRQYRAALLGFASFIAISVASMAYLGPTLKSAWLGSLQNVFGYQGKRIAEWSMRELAENHSLFTWVKTVAVVFRHSPAALTLPYYVCGGLIFALIFFGRLQRLPVANQLLGVSVFMVLLPPVSYFHTLVHLYVPWLLLVFLAVRADRAGVRVAGLNTTILCFLPVFACFTLLNFPRAMLFGGLMQFACLVVLLLRSTLFVFALPAAAEMAGG